MTFQMKRSAAREQAASLRKGQTARGAAVNIGRSPCLGTRAPETHPLTGVVTLQAECGAHSAKVAETFSAI